MEKLRAIVVDDESKNREALSKMIYQFCPTLEIVGKAENITEAYNLIISEKPNIVFLDIEMPGGDGFELLKKFETINFSVVFTTAHADYAIKALKIAAADYLLKPIDLQELKEAVLKIGAIQNGEGAVQNMRYDVIKGNLNDGKFKFNRIALPTFDGLEFFEIEDVIRCEADRAYCKFHIKDGRTILVSKALKEFEELLLDCNFFRVHKSHMINLEFVSKYVKGKGGYVVLKDGSNVDVSVRRKDEFLKVFSKSN